MRSLKSIVERFAGFYENRRLHKASAAHATAHYLPGAQVWNNGRPQAIRIAEHTRICGELLVYPDGGQIRIGSHCFIGKQTRIWSGIDVMIGDRVLVSHNVNIHDSDSHSRSARARHEHVSQILLQHNAALGDVPKAPIVIEDDAWIGFNAVIMKGVRIGRGAIVAAGAVVTRDVLPFTVVAGVPATSIGQSLE